MVFLSCYQQLQCKYRKDSEMKLAIYAFSKHGCSVAKAIQEKYESDVYTIERLAKEFSFKPIKKGITASVGQCFSQVDALIFIGACGIAVRAIAPYVKSKATDPAVIVIDDQAIHAISLLSGHLGGANELTIELATLLGASPVITTATDVSGKFSVDDFARKHNCILDNLSLAKEVSAEILNTEIPFLSDFSYPKELPFGLKVFTDRLKTNADGLNAYTDGLKAYTDGLNAYTDGLNAYTDGLNTSSDGNLGIYLTYHKRSPFEKTLRLIYPSLHVGIGCRRGTSLETIQELLNEVFLSNELEERAIKSFASINLKKEEEGIKALANRYQVPFVCYSSNRLQELEGDFTASEFVASVTGVDNVCERAAVLSSGGKELIVNKKSKNGVTIAVSKEEFRW